ncbi:MAG TPA: hypothetical protein VHO03_03805 [Ignavibacteriales bacterium]|nr:hypothetical protein [Ignavibacteriales bacterium]
MSNQTTVWVKVQLSEDLHADLKAAAVREKKPNGERKTLQDKVVEMIELGYKTSQKKVS